MICYMDRTFCSSPNCKNKCGRKFLKKHARDARKWWKSKDNPTGEGAPIAFSNYCDEVECAKCMGFGYTKGSPGAPWDKVDCKACDGTGKSNK